MYLKLLNEDTYPHHPDIHEPPSLNQVLMGIGGVGLGLYGGYKGYQYFCEHMVKSYTWKDTKQLNPNVFKIVESKYNFRIPKELKEVLKVANGGYPIYKGKRLTEMVRSGIDIFGYYYKSASLQFNRFLSFK